jgi:hypothetical protein
LAQREITGRLAEAVCLNASAAHSPKKSEGVGERPGFDPPTDCSAVARYGNLRSLFFTLSRSARAGEARTLVSPTPSVVDQGRAVSKHDRDALTALRLAPARLTQSSTSFEVEDCEAARAYFFFRRLVFFAPFFAADFVFVFRFFAMLPS